MTLYFSPKSASTWVLQTLGIGSNFVMMGLWEEQKVCVLVLQTVPANCLESISKEHTWQVFVTAMPASDVVR